MCVPMMTVRPARPADLPALHAIAGRAVHQLLDDVYTAEQLGAAAAVGVYRVEPDLVDAGTYWVVEIGGTVVAGSGWSPGGSFRPDKQSGGPEVTDPATAAMRATYVEPQWTRQGLATLLARTTETAARIAGFTRFEALCTPASEALRRSLGYRVVNRVDASIGTVTLPVAHMRKVLPCAPAACRG
jgi:GNAT superfamily N-acetyltransferase